METPGERLGKRFTLGALAGRGAFAEVYRAIDGQTGQVVALKLLKAKVADPLAPERFEREAQLLASIEDAHVVGYVAHGMYGDRPWLALEWLEGRDLAEQQREAPLPLATAIDAVRQAALGLAALHAQGIVHRDVKPSNFFLVDDLEGPRLKLIDLGVARATESVLLTTAGLRIGTPAYMSPEQAAGDDNVGPLSDIYSLGVVLYELVTGQRPFQARDPLALLAKIVLDEPAPLGERATGLPQELEAVTDQMLGKRPEARPRTALAVAERLAGVQVGDRASAVVREEPATQAERPSVLPELIERRVVTTVFCVLPADGPDALEAVRDLLTSFGAEVHRLLGRRLVAVFGLSRSVGDEPLRAARAALAVSATIGPVRLAVATGYATAGGATVSGQVIDRATGELEQAQDGIHVDLETARRLERRFVVALVEGRRILRGARAISTALEPKLLGRETRMAERDRELDQLEDVVTDAIEQRCPAAALVTGAPGMGKSRLRYELFRRLDELAPRPFVVLLRCDPTLVAVPHGVLAHALRRMAGIEARMSAEEQRHRVSRFAEQANFEGEVAYLVQLLGIAAEGDEELRGDPAALAAQLRGAAVDLLQAWCRRSSSVLLVDDVQWADSTTIDTLTWALDELADESLVLVGFGRPELDDRFPALWSAVRLERLPLAPLSRRACERLAAELLASGADKATLRSIAERADGNPLFLEELVRAASQGGEELPMAIQAAFQIRLDTLPPPAKQAALAASVFGRSVWDEALAAVLGQPDVALPLVALAHWEVLAERPRSRFGSTTEYVFRHALLRDVAYAMLGPTDRATFHGRAARWLADQGERDHAVLAYHHGEAGETFAAAQRLALAAEQARDEGAFATALEHAERAIELEPPDYLVARLSYVAASSCHKLGRYEASLVHSERGVEAADEPVMLLDLIAARTLTLRRRGRIRDAIRAAEATLEATRGEAATPSLVRARAHAQTELGWTYYGDADPERALATARDVLASLPAIEPELTAVRTSAQHLSGRSLHALGQLDLALEAHRDAVERATAEGHRWRGEGARHGLGQVLLALGATAEAIQQLQEACEQGRALSLPSTEAHAELFLALAHRRREDHTAAVRAAARVGELGAELGAPALVAASGALSALLAGDVDDHESALASADEALALARAPLSWRAAARGAKACALLARGQGAEALAEARAVVAMLEDPMTSPEGHDLAAERALYVLEASGADDAITYRQSLDAEGERRRGCLSDASRGDGLVGALPWNV